LLREGRHDAEFFTALDRYVSGRLAERVTLTETARQFDLPPSTLTRRIERRYGVTFTGFIARHRMERAKALLTRTQLSVDAVAKRAGLTDGAHLRKLLDRFEGAGPSDFRRPAHKKAAGTE
jgi:AraC family transcriptional activator FtrA